MTVCRKHPGRGKAFTLLELILVMIILCVVLAMAAPSLRGFFSSHQLNDIAEQIVVMTRYAKIQSAFQSRTYRLNFDMNERRCWISVQGETQYELLKQSFGNDFLIPNDLTVTFEDVPEEAGLYYFEFNPAGYANTGRVRLEDNQDNILDIVCCSPSENFEIFEVVDGQEQYQ